MLINLLLHHLEHLESLREIHAYQLNSRVGCNLPWKPKILHLLDLIYTSLNEHKDTATELGLIHWNAANAEPFLLLQNIRTPLRQCLSRDEESCSSLLSVLEYETSVKMFMYSLISAG